MIQNSVLGDSFCILCFIRQDGVLSTVLVAFYVDDITVNPWNCSYVLQVGCLYFYSLYLVLYLSCIWVSLILPGHSLCPCWRLRKTVRGSHEYTADFSHGFWYSVPVYVCCLHILHSFLHYNCQLWTKWCCAHVKMLQLLTSPQIPYWGFAPGPHWGTSVPPDVLLLTP